MATIEELRRIVSATKPKEAAEMTRTLLAEGHDPMAILEDGVMSGLSDVGDRFATKKAIVLALVRAGVTAKACIPIIELAFPKGESRKIDRKIVLGTMLSQHNIGKNLVGGAVTSQAWASDQGADGWGAQAKDGVLLAKQLLRLA